jgi:hypothetical protein
MITPESIYKKRIWFKVIEFEEVIDSSQMQIKDYIKIASCLEENYD